MLLQLFKRLGLNSEPVLPNARGDSTSLASLALPISKATARSSADRVRTLPSALHSHNLYRFTVCAIA
eukprot:CAMPEP_0204124924 /NCGR_PEP_ID=MMETSP0361-20130328/10125_1 /ASSEMBLY_ACC=CAM_ASM_000343 /TAXON_ID=268821 /ORGANISM="Scrippsiella Hangoei, Strain SHTV-5" /LENGTH=67 /DNA_ID=CAMNT_0051076553 /DNA_START=247 /DNA_END=447 /DNA_ORIENTATION=+